jgi:Uma2 family endonuclease
MISGADLLARSARHVHRRRAMIQPMSKRPPATYADLEALPDNIVGEIIDGELYTQPRPASPHAAASSQLGGELHGPFRHGRGGPGGWIILDEPELHLGPRPDILVPDIAGWRRTRMPERPNGAAFTLAPDWVCEVISPGTEAKDRVKKMPVYAREGVGHIWLVDPLERTLEIFRLESGRWVLAGAFAGETKVRAEPFDAIDLDLAILWST